MALKIIAILLFFFVMFLAGIVYAQYKAISHLTGFLKEIDGDLWELVDGKKIKKEKD